MTNEAPTHNGHVSFRMAQLRFGSKFPFTGRRKALPFTVANLFRNTSGSAEGSDRAEKYHDDETVVGAVHCSIGHTSPETVR